MSSTCKGAGLRRRQRPLRRRAVRAGGAIASVFGTAIVVTQQYILVDGRIASLFVIGGSIGKSVLPPLISTVFAALGGWAFLGLLLLFAVRPR